MNRKISSLKLKILWQAFASQSRFTVSLNSSTLQSGNLRFRRKAKSCVKTAYKIITGFSTANRVLADRCLAVFGWPFPDLSHFHHSKCKCVVLLIIMDVMTELTLKKSEKKKKHFRHSITLIIANHMHTFSCLLDQYLILLALS